MVTKLRATFGFPSAGDLTGGVAMLYEFANALSRCGHDVRFVHGPAWPTRVASLSELPPKCFEAGVDHFLVDALDDPSIPAGDVFFSHSGPPRLGHPCIVMQGYGLFTEGIDNALFRFPAPKVCVARWLVDVGHSLDVPEEQLVHVPLGIDHSIFHVSTPLDERPIDVAGLYHPHVEKGWPDLLAVLTALSESRRDFRGLVFGRDLPSETLPRGVEFVQAPDHRQLAREVYAHTRVWVQASLREGFGLTPVEAMACGAALVTTNNGGSQDYGIDDVTARVVAPGDVPRLISAVEGLLDHEDDRLRLAQGGLDHVATLDWAVSGQTLSEFLGEYVENPQRFGRA